MDCTLENENDTISLNNDLLEEEEMALAKFHGFNEIYLYCIVEAQTAFTIVKGVYPNILNLYETICIAKEMTSNTSFKKPVAIRFAVSLEESKEGNAYCYDEFTMSKNEIAKRIAAIQTIKTKEDYIATCGLIRKLAKTPNNMKAIEYIVKDKRRIINAQIIQ